MTPDGHNNGLDTCRTQRTRFDNNSQAGLSGLKPLAEHKTDRNDARSLAHLARTGFYKPTHVKSLSAHAVRSLIAARKKLVGQRVTIDNQIRGRIASPASASWLNLVERFFAKITSRRIRHGSYSSVDDLEVAIYDYLAQQNDTTQTLQMDQNRRGHPHPRTPRAQKTR